MAKDMATAFVQEALSHTGEHGQWTWKTYSIGPCNWCAAFVYAVAKTVGIGEKCICKTAMAEEHARSGVRRHMGTFYKSGARGGTYVPVLGDLISFNRGKAIADQYTANHVGIVTAAKSGKVYTVEGNTHTDDFYTSIVRCKDYSLSNSEIVGYFHPKWSLADGIEPPNTYTGGNGSVSSIAQLYDTSTTRKDMTLREIGYLNSSLQPSIQASQLTLSAINYTGVLSSIFQILAPDCITNGGGADTDKLTGNRKICLDYLMSKGLNCAAACGVCGNIQQESGYNPGSVNSAGYSGICQWGGGRYSAMTKFVGSNWRTNLSGQLDFLWKELTGGYKTSTLDKLKKVSNDEAGVKSAAEIFLRNFEKPGHYDVEVPKRQDFAIAVFKKCVITSGAISGPATGASSSLSTKKKKK